MVKSLRDEIGSYLGYGVNYHFGLRGQGTRKFDRGPFSSSSVKMISSILEIKVNTYLAR